ncbi:MAG: NAD-dependent DNA ligase LigA [Chitinophagales bacterium]|nr:NAD-dependent DNA ligase LigA [Chitinophagales bacterium]
MYTKQDEQRLYELAKNLLKKDGEDKGSIEPLREVINFADRKYYIEDEPVLADVEYDTLFKQLKNLEAKYPELITEDSPTQRVAQGLSEKFPTVNHLVPMLSLDNTYNADDLYDWDKRCKEFAGTDNIEYCVEPKYDGASISLIYENGQLVRGATRGDGVQGEDITVNAKLIRSLPLSAKFVESGITQVEIRGEVVIHKDVFAKFNEQRAAEGLAPLANPRNAASGTLRILDPQEVVKRKLSAIVYHISDYTLVEGQEVPSSLHTHYDALQWLYNAGFPTPVKEMKVCKNIDEVIAFCAEFEQRRDDLPFEVDGLVVKVNDFEMQDKMGMTSHHPRWAVAYKFKARQATSKLLDVDYQVGRTGAITPVAKIEPTPIGGVTVSSISLFNEDVVREKDLRIGDTVLVERAGDVIPYIVKSLPELRTGSEEEIIFPTTCPVCNDKLERPEGEAVWRCVNINCAAQVVERIIHFASKSAMDIRNLGDSNIRKFYELEMLKDIPGVYKIDWSAVLALEGFKEKSVNNLQDAIEKSKEQPLNRVIFGLGIRYVGETTAKTLASAVQNLKDLKDWDEEKLSSLEDVGPKVASSVVQFFRNEDNLHMLDELEQAGLSLENKLYGNKKAGGVLEGKTFLFTGTLTKFKRSEAEEMVEARGGKKLGGVSSKLDYLVVGADAGSKLEKAKKLGTVTILTEDEFLEMLQ